MRMLQQGASLQELYNYVRELENKVSRLQVVGDNRTTSVTRTNAGQIVHALPQRMNGFVQSGGAAPVATPYEGPWKLSYDQANNRAVVTDGYFIAGNSRFGATGTTSVSLASLATGKVYVFLHCYVTSEGLAGTWHWELLAWNNQDYLIQQTGWTRGLDYRNFCVTVGVMDYDSENQAATGIQQWHTGNVYISGRMV